MSIHEICSITAAKPCGMAQHGVQRCNAMRLVEAFAAYKGVTLVGGISGAKRHVPSRVLDGEVDRFARFNVVKVNKLGVAQQRTLMVRARADGGRGAGGGGCRQKRHIALPRRAASAVVWPSLSHLSPLTHTHTHTHTHTTHPTPHTTHHVPPSPRTRPAPCRWTASSSRW